MEGFLVIFGLCLVFLPFIQLCQYLLKRVIKKTKFDMHLEKAKEKGNIYVFIAYSERILYGIVVSVFGFWMSELFDNNIAFIIFVLTLMMFIIIKYFDCKNDINNK